MKGRHRWITIAVAVPGLVMCFLAMGGFVRKMLTNGLPWDPSFSARQYYLVVGDAYSRGFVTGFFLCFFLVLVTLAVANGLVRRRRPRIARNRVPMRAVAPGPQP